MSRDQEILEKFPPYVRRVYNPVTDLVESPENLLVTLYHPELEIMAVVGRIEWLLFLQFYRWSAERENLHWRMRTNDKNRVTLSAHRLIFYYHHGFWPELVDHIEQYDSGIDNTISNLREITRQGNAANAQCYKLHGFRKVKNGKYQALIKVKGRQLVLGTYKTEREAALAYDEAALAYHGEFARLNYPKPKDDNPPVSDGD